MCWCGTDVAYASLDYKVKAHYADTPYGYSLYNLDLVQAPCDWNQETVGTSNVAVCIIDSGIQVNHPDLASNVWVNTAEIPNNGIDDDGNGTGSSARDAHVHYRSLGLREKSLVVAQEHLLLAQPVSLSCRSLHFSCFFGDPGHGHICVKMPWLALLSLAEKYLHLLILSLSAHVPACIRQTWFAVAPTMLASSLPGCKFFECSSRSRH